MRSNPEMERPASVNGGHEKAAAGLRQLTALTHYSRRGLGGRSAIDRNPMRNGLRNDWRELFAGSDHAAILVQPRALSLLSKPYVDSRVLNGRVPQLKRNLDCRLEP
jgi:hypothetical protein